MLLALNKQVNVPWVQPHQNELLQFDVFHAFSFNVYNKACTVFSAFLKEWVERRIRLLQMLAILFVILDEYSPNLLITVGRKYLSSG